MCRLVHNVTAVRRPLCSSRTMGPHLIHFRCPDGAPALSGFSPDHLITLRTVVIRQMSVCLSFACLGPERPPHGRPARLPALRI